MTHPLRVAAKRLRKKYPRTASRGVRGGLAAPPLRLTAQYGVGGVEQFIGVGRPLFAIQRP